MALASKGPIQMGSPVLFDKSIRRTTNPFEVESNVKNFTFISTYILSLLSRFVLFSSQIEQLDESDKMTYLK
jgi:hypothetical protein